MVAKHQEELEKLSKELEEKEKIKEELEAMQNVGFSALIILISLAVWIEGARVSFTWEQSLLLYCDSLFKY